MGSPDDGTGLRQPIPEPRRLLGSPFADLVTEDGRLPGFTLHPVLGHSGRATVAQKRRWWKGARTETASDSRPVVVYHDGERWRFMVALIQWGGSPVEYTADLYAEGFALFVRELRISAPRSG